MTEVVEADVVVIGGGVSGLTSAYHLKNKDPNLKVIVLEAKDRVGGRTMLQEMKAANGTDHWDFGGQWVGTCQPHVMALIKELGLDVYQQYSKGRKVMQLGDNKVRTYTSDIPSMNVVALLDLHRMMTRLDKWLKCVPVEDPGKCPDAKLFDSMTLDEALRKHGWTQSMQDAMVSAFRCMFGVEPSEMGLLYFLSYCNAAGGISPLIECKENSGQEFKIKGGAGQIAPLLAEHVGSSNVWLGQPVRSVVQEKDCVMVTTAKGRQISCSRVIVATPPNQTVKMEFEPMFPTEKLHVLQNMPIGYITKIIITYEKAFWREKGFSGEIVTNGGPALVDGVTSGPLCICYDATTSNGNPALVGFIGGKQQREYNKLPAEDRQKAVIESFVSYFGDEARDFLDYREKDWGLEPFSGGGPVCVGKPGMMSFAATGLREPFNKIHFAGTESATTWAGFINGAIQSGYRAANEVLYNLRPQAVTTVDLKGTNYDPSVRNVKVHRQEGYGRLAKFFVAIGCVCLIGLFIKRRTSSS